MLGRHGSTRHEASHEVSSPRLWAAQINVHSRDGDGAAELLQRLTPEQRDAHLRRRSLMRTARLSGTVYMVCLASRRRSSSYI